VFRHEGTTWQFAFSGQHAQLPDAKGLHDIAAGNPYYWIGDTYAKVAIVAAGAASMLGGDGKDASGGDAANQNNWDYGVQVAQPANTSQQRLGVSGRSAE